MRAGEVVLVTLPPAEHITEVHFAAITLVNGRADRYFVLEHSWTLDDSPATVMGEWADGVQFNLGSGPEPTATDFLLDVDSRLG
jgi:hypothetical protein